MFIISGSCASIYRDIPWVPYGPGPTPRGRLPWASPTRWRIPWGLSYRPGPTPWGLPWRIPIWPGPTPRISIRAPTGQLPRLPWSATAWRSRCVKYKYLTSTSFILICQNGFHNLFNESVNLLSPMPIILQLNHFYLLVLL